MLIKTKRESGQVTVLFALVFSFMFILFAFVVDFGHVINNKINLQLAADQAAYAGAAWQARMLNHLAALNYRMRQDVKEMTMRVQVTHLRHNRNFPSGRQYIDGNPQLPQVEPFICQQAHGYVAISGISYGNDTNLCRNASPSTGGLPPIIVPPVIAAFDPFVVAMTSQIRRIQQTTDQACRAAAEDNRVLAEHLVNVYTSRSRYHANQIESIAQYMNLMATENPPGNHPGLRSAYETALGNLTLSNTDDFKFEILRPRGNEYIRLKQHPMRASIFYVNFSPRGSGCIGQAGYLDFNDMLAGFSKQEDILTYFAVKLTAKPKMFFMPAPWADAFPELVAFAAAKPFGSRIGPKETLDPLLPVANRPGNNNRTLNFSFRPNDNLGLQNTKMMAYLDILHPFNVLGRPDGNRQSGWPDAAADRPSREAMQAIRSPTIFDSLFYTVIPDPNVQSDYQEPEFAAALYPDYLEAADGAADAILELPQSRTPAYFPTAVGSRNKGPGWIQINAEESGVSDPYEGYAEESVSSHALRTAVGLPLLESPEKARQFGFATPDDIHSGWTPPRHRGRIGYSVKFVGINSLYEKIQIRDSAGNLVLISNRPEGDPNIPRVLH